MAREMKDSGIEWIGEIPKEWEIKKLKYISRFRQEKYDETYGNLVYIGLENVEGWSGNYIETDSIYDKRQSVIFQENDILWGKLRPYLAKVYYCTTIGCCSSEFCVINIGKIYDIRFFWFLLISSTFVDTVNCSTYGTKMPRANADFIKNLYVPIPSVIEQSLISRFLDNRNKELGNIIAKTCASIEEYKKLKQAVITQAVTKGIRGDREMKNSGIEWIEEIPVEWEERRIKSLFALRDEKNYLPLEEVNLLSLYTDLGVVQHIELEKTTGNKASNADGYKRVYRDDIVVNIILCWMGAIGRSEYNGVTSPAYDIYIPQNEVLSKFYHYYFRTKGFSGDCYKRGKGIMAMRWRTYSDQFRDIKVVYPSLEEQKEIVNYLDQKCSAIDEIIAKKEQYLSEIENYKKSIIYEYVTGKREVPQES